MNIDELRKQYLTEVDGSSYLDYTGIKSEQYIHWLEQTVVNKNDLLQRVSGSSCSKNYVLGYTCPFVRIGCKSCQNYR